MVQLKTIQVMGAGRYEPQAVFWSVCEERYATPVVRADYGKV